jgi:MFS family permease
VLVPMISQARYGITAFGWLSAATFVGSVLGSIVGARIHSARPGVWAMNALAPCLLTPVCLVLPVPLWLFCVSLATGSVGVGCFMVLWYSALQREIPEEIQGRVFALEGLASFGLEPIALASAPLLVELLGIESFGVIAVAVLLVSTYAVLLVPGTIRLATPTTEAGRSPSSPVTTTAKM